MDYISIVMPVYRGEKTITNAIKKVEHVLKGLTSRYEVIVVVDGYSIDTTFQRARSTEKKYKGRVRVLGYSKNRGKGYAVRYGFKRAKGNIVGFIDSDMDIDPKAIKTLYLLLQIYKADAIVGSKEHPASIVAYPKDRRVMSSCFQFLTKILFNFEVKDTQAGIKIFRRGVLKSIMPKLRINTWAFDVEILALLRRFGYSRVYEAPIIANIRSQEKSVLKQGLYTAIFQLILGTFLVFYRLNISKEYLKT